MLPAITAPGNDEVKRLARLARVRERREQGRFLVEGRRAIAGFLAAGWRPEQLLVASAQEVPPDWPRERVRRVSDRVIDRIGGHRSSSGYVAEFTIPEAGTLDPALGGVVAMGLADPGNLGTLIRGAAACGWRQVAVCAGADPYGPKAVQASAGALGAVRLARLEPAAVLELQTAQVPLVALVVRGGRHPAELAPGPAWLVVGSEAEGLEAELVAGCRERASLPMVADVESLNAGVAGVLAAFLLRGLHQPPDPD